MEFVKRLFNKHITELSYEDIETYFQHERTETINLEFKSYNNNNNKIEDSLEGIRRCVCAMLNSDGGVIIWGAPSGKQDVTRRKIFIGELTPIHNKIDKDWLISKISDSITPLPTGIKVQELKKNNNDYIYVFEIEQSNYPPHQFNNNYFIRLDGQNKPAPHYFIEALFKKVRYPNIEGHVKLNGVSETNNKKILTIGLVLYNFSPFQNEERLTIRVIIEGDSYFENYNSFLESTYHPSSNELLLNSNIQILHYGEPYILEENIIIANDKEKIGLLFSFGGRYSPIKSSYYQIDLNLLLENYRNNNNLMSAMETIESNVLVINKHINNGITKKDILDNLIGPL